MTFTLINPKVNHRDSNKWLGPTFTTMDAAKRYIRCSKKKWDILVVNGLHAEVCCIGKY